MTRATIKSGSTGTDVTAWQKIIGVTQTGIFDTATLTATKSWQQSHGLVIDGIVGPKTWASAESSITTVAKSAGTSILSTLKNIPIWSWVAGGVVVIGSFFIGKKMINNVKPYARNR